MNISDLTVGQYILFDSSPDMPIAVVLERCKARDGSVRWAIREGGSCLGKDGEWIIEPIPSSRDDNFFMIYRWTSAENALRFWIAAGRPDIYARYRRVA